MDFKKIKKNLIEHNYICVRLDSNHQVLTQIHSQKNSCILEEDIDSKKFLSKLDYYFEKFSLLYVHDFQRLNIFSRQILEEWYKIYKKGDKKLPYLLISTFCLEYDSDLLPLSIDKKRFLDFSKNTPDVKHSAINFLDPSDVDYKLYDRLYEIVIRDYCDKKGYRGLIIFPNTESLEYLYHKLEEGLSEHNVIRIDKNIPPSVFFSPDKSKKYTKNFIFLSLDMTHRPLFFHLDIVYDSGEKDIEYLTRSGVNRLKTIKINRQEMKTRMLSYQPEQYMIMFPKTSILNLDKYPEKITDNSLDILYILSVLGHCSDIPKDLHDYGAVKRWKDGWKVTKKGFFCMNINIPVMHSTFLFEALTKNWNINLVVILISIFTNIDLVSPEISFEKIFKDVCKLEEKNIFYETVQELIKNFEIDQKIIDGKKELSILIPHIKDHYRLDIVKYNSGFYENGKGQKYCVKKHTDSQIILPLSVWKNEKGENFIDHFLPLPD